MVQRRLSLIQSVGILELEMRHFSPSVVVSSVPEEHSRRVGFFAGIFRRKAAVHAPAPISLEYSADDIEEDNRISQALRRQHTLR